MKVGTMMNSQIPGIKETVGKPGCGDARPNPSTWEAETLYEKQQQQQKKDGGGWE